jgi:hypothetical protein
LSQLIKLLSPKEATAQATARVTAGRVLKTAQVTDPGRVTAKVMVVPEIMEASAQATERVTTERVLETAPVTVPVIVHN